MTGFQLKLLAMLAMTADHIGAVFFPEIPLLRWIGRLAMPVLCFFIGEGLRHTRSPRRYLLRLTGFALLSELPFDLAFYGGIERGHQNAYFTLALGLLALWAIQSRGMEGWLLALTAALAAELLGCDYGMYGVLLILLLDRFHRARSEQLAAAALLNLAFFGLQSAEGYIRRELARTINMRNTPEIRFIVDQSIEYGVNISRKIDEVTRDLDNGVE